ncbi:ABC transporter permease [Jeotgalibacillus proteolyticus]|uniref:ABC transporter permease n=1 Tax=Jeotgalibacillus proteolyticus TaxID=2082395 RepID=A0A2S5G8K8_9BACL|nr:ABC transporter permease [Jeotgalibacillus proteolyticus]PPA69309.1 ABC transporter permease [Jeotgalibacillus proteolyticus]
MWKQQFTKTGKMILFILRRDRIRLPVWLISLTFLTLITAIAFADLYSSDQERMAIAETMRNPAMTAMVGPGYGLDDYTIGAMMAHQMLLFTAIVVGIMSILLVTRHTRGDEEEGRIELIRSLPVGRLANLAATLIVLFSANVVLALLIGLGLFSLDIESMGLSYSLLFGAALGAAGFFFAAVTALFAQLSENSRGAIGYSFAVLGLAYIIRAIGDVSNETLSWFSPLGWILGTEVYVNNYWWPVWLTVGFTLLITAIALYLNTIRDLESGFLPSRPGKKQATPLLLSPFGLVLRLQRTSIISWGVGMFLIGASYGSVLGDLESFFASNEVMSQMLGEAGDVSLTEQFLTMIMAVMAMICTVPALLFMLKLKGEEKKNRTEHFISRSVSKWTLIGSYFTTSIVFGFVMLFLAVTGLWSASFSTMDEPISFLSLFNGGMVYLPAIWVMIGAAVLFTGLIPQLTGLSWLYLGYSFFVVYLGGLMQFPEWLGKLSPFGHIPQIPVEEFNLLNLALLTLIALLLTAAGFAGFKKRDLTG